MTDEQYSKLMQILVDIQGLLIVLLVLVIFFLTPLSQCSMLDYVVKSL